MDSQVAREDKALKEVSSVDLVDLAVGLVQEQLAWAQGTCSLEILDKDHQEAMDEFQVVDHLVVEDRDQEVVVAQEGDH